MPLGLAVELEHLRASLALADDALGVYLDREIHAKNSMSRESEFTTVELALDVLLEIQALTPRLARLCRAIELCPANTTARSSSRD